MEEEEEEKEDSRGRGGEKGEKRRPKGEQGWKGGGKEKMGDEKLSLHVPFELQTCKVTRLHSKNLIG